ncbi:MAG: 50S ribosomal protein L15e [archaeon]
MGLYKYIRELYKQPKKNLGIVYRERLIRLRRSPASERIERPTRLDRARSLGYKAKQGVFVVRQRVIRGGRVRPQESIGRRRPKTSRRTKIVSQSYQQIAEQRVQKHYPNAEVLNSYEIAKDGRHAWYEIIMVDPSHPSILADKDLNWIAEKQHKKRVYRGLTSSGKSSRGLRKKGIGSEKTRPSIRAKGGLAH